MPNTLLRALNRATRAAGLDARDDAAVALARELARLIDADPARAWHERRLLLEVLGQLRLTPRARGVSAPARSLEPPTLLAQLRARRGAE